MKSKWKFLARSNFNNAEIIINWWYKLFSFRKVRLSRIWFFTFGISLLTALMRKNKAGKVGGNVDKPQFRRDIKLYELDEEPHCCWPMLRNIGWRKQFNRRAASVLNHRKFLLHLVGNRLFSLSVFDSKDLHSRWARFLHFNNVLLRIRHFCKIKN